MQKERLDANNKENLDSYLIQAQSSILYNCIKALLRKYLNANRIKCRESDGTEYNITDSIPVEQFAERLWPIIESYSDDKISIDKGYPTMLRIKIYNTVGQGIMYQCLPSENCELILKKLQNICKIIISDINTELTQINERKSNHEMLVNDLLLCLDRFR